MTAESYASKRGCSGCRGAVASPTWEDGRSSLRRLKGALEVWN